MFIAKASPTFCLVGNTGSPPTSNRLSCLKRVLEKIPYLGALVMDGYQCRFSVFVWRGQMLLNMHTGRIVDPSRGLHGNSPEGLGQKVVVQRLWSGWVLRSGDPGPEHITSSFPKTKSTEDVLVSLRPAS